MSLCYHSGTAPLHRFTAKACKPSGYLIAPLSDMSDMSDKCARQRSPVYRRCRQNSKTRSCAHLHTPAHALARWAKKFAFFCKKHLEMIWQNDFGWYIMSRFAPPEFFRQSRTVDKKIKKIKNSVWQNEFLCYIISHVVLMQLSCWKTSADKKISKIFKSSLDKWNNEWYIMRHHKKWLLIENWIVRCNLEIHFETSAWPM